MEFYPAGLLLGGIPRLMLFSQDFIPKIKFPVTLPDGSHWDGISRRERERGESAAGIKRKMCWEKGARQTGFR